MFPKIQSFPNLLDCICFYIYPNTSITSYFENYFSSVQIVVQMLIDIMNI